MKPILYIEARCEECNDEITNQADDIEFAVLRSGKLLCKTCAELKPDRILKWFTVEKLPEPEEEPEAPEEKDAIDRAREERTDKQS